MKILIIEDEQIASQNLEKMLAEVDSSLELAGTLQTVEEAVEFFNHKPDVDLVFMDIHLADGLAFHIFDSTTIDCPIIFTTAYDQYALDAFKVGGIDYLLKPINKDDLQRAIAKVKRLTSHPQPVNAATIAAMSEMLQPRSFKSYFLIPLRDKLIPLKVSDIAFIYVDEKVTHAVTMDGQSHIMDKPLDNIFSQLDPSRFFRANRQYIIAHDAVKEISLWPLSKLQVTLSIPTPEKIIIPRARTSEFKEWYTR